MLIECLYIWVSFEQKLPVLTEKAHPLPVRQKVRPVIQLSSMPLSHQPFQTPELLNSYVFPPISTLPVAISPDDFR